MTGKRSNLARIGALAVALVALGLGAFLWWALMVPKIGSVSEDEVRSLLPADLLATDPVDPTALQRGKQVMVELQAMGGDIPQFEKMEEAGSRALGDRAYENPEDWPRGPAVEFVAKDTRKLIALRATLASGPAVLAQSNDLNVLVSELREVFEFERSLCWCAEVMAKIGKRGDAKDIMLTALLLADRAYDGSSRSLISNLEATLDQYTAEDAVKRIVQAGRFTSSQCKMLLSEMPAAPDGDTALSDAIRTEFQQRELPVLINPTGKEGREYLSRPDYNSFFSDDKSSHKHAPPVRGSYDAIETIRTEGQITETAMKNAREPLAKCDRSGDKLASQLSEGLPGLWEASPDNLWDRLKLKYAMVTGHNTLGRQLIQSYHHSVNMVETSCELRAEWDLTRVLLASRIYSAEHAGRLPASTDGFVPILGAWPTDPFNGKPMLYKPAKGVVYCVGENLSDDGGDIRHSEGHKATDVGIRLRGK